jgi:hypothetical protein
MMQVRGVKTLDFAGTKEEVHERSDWPTEKFQVPRLIDEIDQRNISRTIHLRLSDMDRKGTEVRDFADVDMDRV